jgi:hypothetical protein
MQRNVWNTNITSVQQYSIQYSSDNDLWKVGNQNPNELYNKFKKTS